MTEANRIEIPLSKVNVFMVLMGCFAFMILGYFMVAHPQSSLLFNQLRVKIAGGLVLIFCGAGAAFGIFKLFDKRPGLVLDRAGLIDNASAIAAGRIDWSEIQDIRTLSVREHDFLMIFVRDPDRYVHRANPVMQIYSAFQLDKYGTPIFISAAILETNFSALEKTVREYWARYRGGEAPYARGLRRLA
ncbi:MAG TPA: STM3941 family protein [Rhizomicrobium sp.]|nr:STM3941 family protein [Rhizomicrobium sp.]